jgi:hypothetical protein
MAFYQQGDVLIKELKDPWRLEQVKKRETQKTESLTVARGETTGHSHVIKGKGILHFIPQDTDFIAFELTEEAVISHEEHNSIVLPPGTYFIETVREYDHFNEETRFVRD